jgi:hypothetical protein
MNLWALRPKPVRQLDIRLRRFRFIPSKETNQPEPSPVEQASPPSGLSHQLGQWVRYFYGADSSD